MKDGGIKQENGCVVICGLNAVGIVNAYLQYGGMIKNHKADAEGNAIVELSNLQKDILIIHLNKMDIKNINR